MERGGEGLGNWRKGGGVFWEERWNPLGEDRGGGGALLLYRLPWEFLKAYTIF